MTGMGERMRSIVKKVRYTIRYEDSYYPMVDQHRSGGDHHGIRGRKNPGRRSAGNEV